MCGHLIYTEQNVYTDNRYIIFSLYGVLILFSFPRLYYFILLYYYYVDLSTIFIILTINLIRQSNTRIRNTHVVQFQTTHSNQPVVFLTIIQKRSEQFEQKIMRKLASAFRTQELQDYLPFWQLQSLDNQNREVGKGFCERKVKGWPVLLNSNAAIRRHMIQARIIETRSQPRVEICQYK